MLIRCECIAEDSTIICLKESPRYVSGIASIMGRMKLGIISRGKNIPERNIMGNYTAIMRGISVCWFFANEESIYPMARNVSVPRTMKPAR